MNTTSEDFSASTPAWETLQRRVLWSFGSTRDREQACRAFLSPFVDGPFSGAALWLDPAPDGTRPRHGLTCAETEGADGAVAETIGTDRPAVAGLAEQSVTVVDEGPSLFGSGPMTTQGGQTMLYEVGTLGVFGLHWTGHEPLDNQTRSFLTSISSLPARFANVLRGCRPQQEPSEAELSPSTFDSSAPPETPNEGADSAGRGAPERPTGPVEHAEHVLSNLRSHEAPVLLIDPDSGRIRMANAAADRFYGYDRATLTQMHIQEINQLSEEEVRRRRAAAASEEKNTFVFPHRLADGEVRMVRVHSNPVEVEGEGTLLLSIIHDASTEFEAREAFRQSQRRYRRLFEQTRDAIVLHGSGGVILEVNPQVADTFGYDEEELVGEPMETLYAPSAEETVASAREDVRRTGSTQFEVQCARKDGTPFWASVSATEISVDRDRAVQCVVRDVTERREAQVKMRALKERYEQVLEAMPVQLAMFDPEGRYEYVNPSSISDPDLRRRIIGMTDVEYARMRGHDLDRAHRRLKTIRRVSRTQETERFEETIPSGQGQDEHHIRSLSPVVVDGATNSVAGFGVEITDLKRVEEDLREARDRAESSLRAREQLMDGLSHDMRTPLHAILGRIETTLRRNLSPDVQANLKSIRHSSEMLLALIEDLLTLSEIETDSFRLNPAPFDPRAVVDKVMDMLSPRAQREDIALYTWTSPAFPSAVAGDALRVRQIVTNLVQNAVKYTEHGAVATTLRYETPDASPTAQMILEVADTGPGLSAETKDRIFEYRRRADAQDDTPGQGLGLSVVEAIVDRMEGTIAVESAPGHGSLFRVVLPLSIVDDPTAVHQPEATQIPDDARLLVVDDTALNREITADLLAEWPVTTDLVADGTTALQRVREEDYDLVMIDLQMPGIDGYETARRIRDQKEGSGPALVAYTASCTASRWDEMRRAGFDDWIQKPQRAGALRRTVAAHTGRAQQEANQPPIPSPDPTEGTSGAPVYDLSFLEDNVGSKVGEYVSLFLDQSRRLEEKMQSEEDPVDWDTLGMTVHQMKASARTVGAEALLRALRRVEEQKPTPSDEAIQALLDRNRDVREALSSHDA